MLVVRLVRVRGVPWAQGVQVRFMLGLCTNRVKDNVSGRVRVHDIHWAQGVQVRVMQFRFRLK